MTGGSTEVRQERPQQAQKLGRRGRARAKDRNTLLGRATPLPWDITRESSHSRGIFERPDDDTRHHVSARRLIQRHFKGAKS